LPTAAALKPDAAAADNPGSVISQPPSTVAPMRPTRLAVVAAVAAVVLLTGCDQLGIESASAVAAKREAEGKAVGGACRHAARSIEQCYTLNKRADKAAVFAGWREMNDYMRENNIAAVPPPPETTAAQAADAEKAEPEADKPATKSPPPTAKKGG